MKVHRFFVTTCSFRLQNDLYCVGWGVKLYSLTAARNAYVQLQNQTCAVKKLILRQRQHDFQLQTQLTKR